MLLSGFLALYVCVLRVESSLYTFARRKGGFRCRPQRAVRPVWVGVRRADIMDVCTLFLSSVLFLTLLMAREGKKKHIISTLDVREFGESTERGKKNISGGPRQLHRETDGSQCVR